MIEDGMLELKEKDYEEVYKLANAIVETQSCKRKNGTDVKSHKVIIANALMEAIDQAREDKVEKLIFPENEILALAESI